MKKSCFLPLVLFFMSLYSQRNKPNVLWIITDDQRADSNDIYNMLMILAPINRF